jgi:uncharacterized membrane protein
MESSQLYLFMAVFGAEEAAEPVAKAIGEAAKQGHVHVDGLAAVHRDLHGHVHIHEIGDITGSQGAVRGAAAGAVVGLLFPPTMLASSVVGGAIASVVAKLHDKGFKTGDLHTLGETLDRGESAVVFVGDATADQSLERELEGVQRVEKQHAPSELPDHIAEYQGAL